MLRYRTAQIPVTGLTGPLRFLFPVPVCIFEICTAISPLPSPRLSTLTGLLRTSMWLSVIFCMKPGHLLLHSPAGSRYKIVQTFSGHLSSGSVRCLMTHFTIGSYTTLIGDDVRQAPYVGFEGGVGNRIVCIHLSYVKVGMASGAPHLISVITYDKYALRGVLDLFWWVIFYMRTYSSMYLGTY